MFGLPISSDFIIVALAILLIIAIVFIVRVEMRLRTIMRGKNMASLEDVLTHALTNIRDLQTSHHEIQDYCAHVERRLRGSVRGVATVRFNAFAGSGDGGKQSFATALISENGDGVVLSSVFARDRVTVFAKPIVKRNSVAELSGEEQQALTEAEKSCKL